MVDRRQPDVLVDSTVTSNEVRLQHLVVVGAPVAVVGGLIFIGVGRQRADGQRPLGAVRVTHRSCVVGDVLDEGVSGAQCVCVGRGDRGGEISLELSAPSGQQLWKPVGPRDEVTVGVGRDQRYVQGIGVAELDAQDQSRLFLEAAPGGHSGLGTLA